MRQFIKKEKFLCLEYLNLVNMPWMAYENLSERNKNMCISALASLLFFTGWWIIIDANCAYEKIFYESKVYHLPGIGGTLALFVVNLIPNGAATGSTFIYSEHRITGFGAIVILFAGLSTAFGGVIGAAYILINDFLCGWQKYSYPGFAIMAQNTLIFLGNMLVKFGTSNADFW